MRPKALIAWSSGKDSAWALHVVRQSGDYDVVGALTTVNRTFARVAMHGVRQQLLEMQIAAAGLKPMLVHIPHPCTNDIYEKAMAEAMVEAKADGITHIIFGDLFLEDIRAYRVEKLKETGITPVFPLWLKPTNVLARDMIASGLQATLATVDLKKLYAEFAGRHFDAALLGDLPQGVDPCGENGEFHTFVCAGPMLARPIPVRVGETIERDGFAYADLLAV